MENSWTAAEPAASLTLFQPGSLQFRLACNGVRGYDYCFDSAMDSISVYLAVIKNFVTQCNALSIEYCNCSRKVSAFLVGSYNHKMLQIFQGRDG